MKKSRIVSFLLLFLAVNFCSAQDLEALDQKMNNFGKKQNTKSWSENNFFLDMKLAAGTEHMVFPDTRITFSENQADTFSWISKPYLFSLASFSIEPRINLKQFDNDVMFFLKAPTGLSFSITTKSTYKMKPGFFHFQTGLLFGFAKGLHSTKMNVENNGFAISFGAQYLRAPLFGHKMKIETQPAISGYGVEYELIDKIRKNSILPTVQFDLFYLNKHNKTRGYSLMVSMYRAFYLKFSMIIPDKAE